MKIRKIKTIKDYKSFSSFSWNDFCKYHFLDKANNVDILREAIFDKFVLIFGENGSGKSTTCDILKSLSQIQDFQNKVPELAEIEIENGSNQVYKFENKKWSPCQLNKNSLLFFDVDFINKNVHTHGSIENALQKGAHTQNAGKLIIDFDEKAHQLEAEVKIKEKEIDNYKLINSVILKRTFTDEEKKLFIIYKDRKEQEIIDEIASKQEENKKTEADLMSLQKANKKYSEIKQIREVDNIILDSSISSIEIYSELFSRQVKEKAQNQADEKIKAHFEKHKSFIEKAKNEIPVDYKNEDCPLCMQPLVNASKIIEYYRAAFDRTYEEEKNKFLLDIQKLGKELERLKLNIGSLPTKIFSIFDSLEKIKIDFGVDVYSIDEKTEYTKKFNEVSLEGGIDKLSLALESLKNIEQTRADFTEIYEDLKNKIEGVKKEILGLNILINEKNEKVSAFKEKYLDQAKIASEIQEKGQIQKGVEEITLFLSSDKIEAIKKQNDALSKQITLSEELKNGQDNLKNHLATTIPESVITKMTAILSKFNLNFTLDHIKPANTKEYSFSFKIKDNKGHERSFKDGLSEGERQLVSLSFFFAINENLLDKANTILIFDDPITSLDSPNLKILSELIHEKIKEFSQVIIFTHHPLFYKYLSKRENPNPCKFGVLKNHEAFGGSFIFCDPGFDLRAEIQKCNEEIKQNAQSGNLKPEEIALKYGQLLRLAVEKFIKYELLLWDKEKNFENEIIANLSKSKSKMQKIDDNDLEVIANIYKYCNHSNLLHVDKENPSALSELITHIDKFTKIEDKVNN